METRISQISNKIMNLRILSSKHNSRRQLFLIIPNIKMNILINTVNKCNFRGSHQFTGSNLSSTQLSLQVNSINSLFIMDKLKANQTCRLKIFLLMVVFHLIISFNTINKITKTQMEDKLCLLMFKLLLFNTNTVSMPLGNLTDKLLQADS